MLGAILFFSGLASAIALLACMAWLKGTLFMVSTASLEQLVVMGMPEWWGVLGPLGLPFLLVGAALMVAHPESRWARWFYGERKMRRAFDLYDYEFGLNGEGHADEPVAEENGELVGVDS